MVSRIRRMLMAWVIVLSSTVPGHGQELVDFIVAVVDNEAILYSDVMQSTQMYFLQTQTDPSAMTQDELTALQQRLMTQMIDSRIIIAAARRDSIAVPVDQIDNAIRQVTDQLSDTYGSREALEQALAQDGFTLRDWHRLLRKQKREEFQQRRLEEERFGQIRVSGKEVEEFFYTNQDSIPIKPVKVTISHIMATVRPEENREGELRARIDEIQRRINAGADFAELASQFSEDLESARNGGDLGFFSRGDFIGEFEDAAFALRPGEISGVVRSSYGFHLIKMEEINGNRARVRQIFIQVPTSDVDDKRTYENLSFLRERIIKGEETFEAAAEKYSEDIDSSQDGGSLGEFRLDQLLVQYQSVVTVLAIGEISEPVKVDEQTVEDTYHLLRLDGRSGGSKMTLEEDWDAIALLAKEYKWQGLRNRWLVDLRQEIYIDERGLDSSS